jgi:hypothetical protein
MFQYFINFIRYGCYGSIVALVTVPLTMAQTSPDNLELICYDQFGYTRLLTAHTDAMLIYDPSRPQDIFWLDTSKKNYLNLLTFENQAWTFIYDRDREIGTLYQRVFGDFYICGKRQPA